MIADHGINFWHVLPCFRINLGGASGNYNTDISIFTAGFPDHLTRLFFGFSRHSACIDNNHIITTGLIGMFPNDFAFPAIQATAKGFDPYPVSHLILRPDHPHMDQIMAKSSDLETP